jgi:hypothetical protein
MGSNVKPVPMVTCRAAMGIARRVLPFSPAFRARLGGQRAQVGPLRPRLPSVGTALSGGSSNQHRQHLLRIEIFNPKSPQFPLHP